MQFLSLNCKTEKHCWSRWKHRKIPFINHPEGELQAVVGGTDFNKYLYSTHNDWVLAQGKNRQSNSYSTGRKGTIWFSKDIVFCQQSTSTGF